VIAMMRRRAGKVDWHPSVLEEARKTGLSVDDEGICSSRSLRQEAVVRGAICTHGITMRQY
jgi:hypothetical protein